MTSTSATTMTLLTSDRLRSFVVIHCVTGSWLSKYSSFLDLFYVDVLRTISCGSISTLNSSAERDFFPLLLNYCLLSSVPSKQYHISTTTNKVYDITERKKFCSNLCFKASNYLKEQLLTSPLWLRDQEILPDIKLLPHKCQNEQDKEDTLITKLTSMKLESDDSVEDSKS